MPRSLWLAGALSAALLLASPASAQPVRVTVTPQRLEEGQPTELRVVFENVSDRALLLLDLQVSIAQGGRERASERTIDTQKVKAIALHKGTGELATFSLLAKDNPGTSDRAAAKAIEASLDGKPYRRLRLLLKGAKSVVRLSCVPLESMAHVKTQWRAIPTRDVPLYAIDRVETWTASPSSSGSEGETTDLHLRLTRWKRWDPDQGAVSVLIAERELGRLGANSGTKTTRLPVRSSVFGRSAAITRAKAPRDVEAVRLSTGTWVLQRGKRWWLVPMRAEVQQGEGRLYLAGCDLADPRKGRVGFSWNGNRKHPKLAADLVAGKLAVGAKRHLGLVVQLDAASLPEFLRVLAKHGATFDEGGIRTGK